MAVKEIKDEEIDYSGETPKLRASVKNRKGGPRLVLMEEAEADALDDADVPHSGIVRDGINIYDESPVRGGRILTFDGKLINHKGHEINADGKVLNPEKYKVDTDFAG